MSDENTVGREPVQILDIVTPKCVNTYGVAPCTATLTGDQKCMNTRATCNDVVNYQARPLAHLTPTILGEQDDVLVSGDFANLADDFLFKTRIRFKTSPVGTIWEQGDSTSGVYFGITGANIVLRAYNGAATPNTTTAIITTPVAPFIGTTMDFIGVVENGTVALWYFDPVELHFRKLGENTLTGSVPATWASTDAGQIGGDNGAIPTGEDGGTFNGFILSFNIYENTARSNLNENEDGYHIEYFFDDGRKAKPLDDIHILPILNSVSAVGARLNLANSDQRYEPIGRRAFMSATFNDAPHSGYPYDPYLNDRETDPLTIGTFWSRWLVQNKFGKTRAVVRLYSGYDGQKLSEMTSQAYVADRLILGDKTATLETRDYLSLTEFAKAQVPAQSDGDLLFAMDAAQTSFFILGDVTDKFPNTGTVRIDDELMTYTGLTVTTPLAGPRTEFTGVTRGTDNSTADTHDIEDDVQLCRRYTSARIDDVLEDLLVNDSQIPTQLLDLAKFTSEYDGQLTAYTLTTLITEPTGVDELIGEIAEQCAFYIWWNERRQIVDMQAIRPLTTVDQTLTEADDIIDGTLTLEERPKERLTTISIRIQPRDYTRDLGLGKNYRQHIIVSNSEATGPDEYGDLPQTRQMYSRWLETVAQGNQTGARYSRRYKDVPQYITFMVDAKDRQLWVGDFISVDHYKVLDRRGKKDVARRWLIIEAEEVEAGHRQKIKAVDITQDGIQYFIADPAVIAATYNAADFGPYGPFITDAFGLNSDGSEGARIG